MRFLKLASTLVLVGLLAALLAACGGSDDKSGGVAGPAGGQPGGPGSSLPVQTDDDAPDLGDDEEVAGAIATAMAGGELPDEIATALAGGELPANIIEALSTADALTDIDDQNADVDACALLTNEEIEAATGLPVTDEPSSADMIFNSCSWNIGDMGASVTLALDDKFLYEQMRGENDEDVDGIGDEAYWSWLHALYVRTGDRYFDIQVVTLEGGDAELNAAKELALKVIERLP